MKHTARQIEIRDVLHPELQYTYIATIGKRVYVRARDQHGTPVYVEHNYKPTFYLPTEDAKSATARGFNGTPLVPVTLDSVSDIKDWIEENPTAFGNIQPEYMVLADCYGDTEVHHDIDWLYVWNLDIEADRDPQRGFAPVDDPFNPITAITVIWHHLGKSGKVVYGTKDYTPKTDETYVQCSDEQELLLTFLTDFRSGGDYPDVLTGWNIQFYDIPYLVNRLKLLFEEDVWVKFSPFERIAARTTTLKGREHTVMDVRGIAILDYLELYQKFTYSQQESYRLDHIAHVELNKRKISYEEVHSLYRLYRENHQKFIEYNVRDVELVDELDAKLKLIELVCALAYSAKSNLTDTFKQVRLWDIMIYHKLRSLGQQIPPRKSESKTDQYAGAFVKEPLVGQHNWVCSFDVASMYPHIIREWNLSPETLLSQADKSLYDVAPDKTINIDRLLYQQVDTAHLKTKGVCMAANGVKCRRDIEGFLPNMLKTLYDERVRYKGLMKKAKKELEHVKEEIRISGETEERAALVKELGKRISACNNQQLVRKVNLNSAYGALGSAYFRFYDINMAEAVTLTGQLIIRWIANDVNAYLNKTFHTNEDYVIASDTDSVYVRMSAVVKAYQAVKPNATKDQIITMLDKFCEQKIQPVLDSSFSRLADYLNVAVACLTMKREVIADKGVWTAKKRYILNVFDDEGVRLDKPKLKIMGIEAIKSSTPAICRQMIKDAITLFMNGTQEDVWRFVKECRVKFKQAPFEDVAFPRSVNGLEKYGSRDKGIPIHVRGALAFNRALERLNLTSAYEPVGEGEKIKFAYLHEPNKFNSHVLSAPGGCPPEFEIQRWVDYETQFEKAFIEPLDAILSCAGWTVEHKATLFD